MTEISQRAREILADAMRAEDAENWGALADRVRMAEGYVEGSLIHVSLRAIERALDEGQTVQAVMDAKGDDARLREALKGIANAVRIGPETDVSAWRGLAMACQQTAIAALSPDSPVQVTE